MLQEGIPSNHTKETYDLSHNFDHVVKNRGGTKEDYDILWLDEVDPRIYTHEFIIKNGQIVFGAEKKPPLEDIKQQKLIELDRQCNETILGRFKSTIGGVEYEFSYDMEAQSRFNGVAVLFLAGKITEMEWTAYVNGERTRIILTQPEFDIVSLAAMNHQATNIAKFNQLLKQVESATTIAEVEAVVW